MKTSSILIILVFLTAQINGQNTLTYSDDITELTSVKLPLTSKKLNTQPKFPGGSKELANYLSNNIKYPRNSRNSSSRGRVIVCFKVEKNGEISEVKIVKGVNQVLNKEAKRVVTNMPNWEPAFENGSAISTVLRIPIVFFRN